MTHIERSIKVDVPPREVFAVLTDLDRLPDWSTITTDTKDASAGDLELGHSFRQTLRIAGRSVETEWRVTELERPQRIAYEATAPGGGHLRMAQRVHDEDGASVIELDLDYELPGGFAGDLLDRAYVERRNEREAEHSLHNLKEMLGSNTA